MEKISGFPWLLLFRMAWIGLAAIILGTSVASVPIAIQRANAVCESPDCLTFDPVAINQVTPEEARALQDINLSIGHYAVYQFSFVLLPALLSLTVAVILFRYPGQSPMARFMAFAFLLWSWFFPPDITYQIIWPSWHRLFDLFLLTPYIIAWQLMFFLFPDGRFAPRWVAPFALGRVALIAAGVLFPESALNEDSWPSWVGLAVNIPVICLGIYSQFYKYRRGTQQLRTQTKWTILGLTAVLVPGFLFVAVLTSPSFSQPGLPRLLAYPPFTLVVAGVYLSFAVAILRHHLWDIQVIIRHTLVYGTLTTAIIAVYVVTVGALGVLLHAQDNLVVALLVTGIVALLLHPLRDRLQHGVNRLIYGERDDPVEALSRLGGRLEAATPPDNLLPALVEAIAQTLRLPYVAIQLPTSLGSNTVAIHGEGTPTEMIRFPLVYQGESVGQLAVGLRGPGSAFNPVEMRLLRNIARQAGATVHAVQLSLDLQTSRQQLVSAREEERRRLRRDLHDGLGATLAALLLEAAVLRRSIRTDPEMAEALVDEFRRNIRAAIEDIRRLVYDLRPPTLDQLGLAEAVRTLAAQCSSFDGLGEPLLKVQVQAPEELPPLPAAIEVAAFRIVQEALTNVVTHARANHCVVRLEVVEKLRVEVTDDGVGLANGCNPNNGLGLWTMRERAVELGGTCVIEPASVGGTRVVASLPLLEV